MGWVETRITRTTQPQDACGLDGNNSFTQRFVDGRFGDRFESLRNIAYGGATPDNFQSAPDKFGKFLRSPGNGAVAFSLDMPRLSGLINLTWLSVFTIPSSSDISGTRRLTGNCYANYGVFRGVSLVISAGVVGVIFAGSGTLTQINGVAPVLDKPNLVTVVIRNNGTNSDVSLYQNGILTAFGTGNFSPHTNFELSGANDDRGLFTINSARHYLTLFLGGGRSEKEIKEVGPNPWQLFEPEVTRIWVDSAASVSLPTLVQPSSTISAGAWTATGAASLHDAINELVPSDTQYISVNSASTTELVLAEAAYPGGVAQAAYYDAFSADSAQLTIVFKQGGTQISTRTHQLTPTNTRYSTIFTPAEIALITAGAISVAITSS